MGGSRYAKEIRIRRKYRRIGRRRTYLQRKRYDFSTRDNMLISCENEQSNETEEDRLAKGLSERSRYFTRMRVTNGRRASRIVYRTRGPGRFQHELRKRQMRLLSRNRARGLGSWKWYDSEVDVTRIDRGRNFGLLFILLGRRYRTYGNVAYVKSRTESGKRSNRIPRDVRTRGTWRSRVVCIGRIENRRERSNRRSRFRLRSGYRRCIEISRIRIYRRKGRKKE